MTHTPQKKNLGQVFLRHPGVIEKIVKSAAVGAEDTVVEIGGGDGRVSEVLARTVGKLVVVEIDPRFVSVLENRFADAGNVHVVSGDILNGSTLQAIKSLIGQGKTTVYGSIPYYITSPILRWVLSNHDMISRAVLLMQAEVVERVTSNPGGKEYGFLSVLMQRYADVHPGFFVRKGSFTPIPKVDSQLLHITPLAAPTVNDEKDFLQFCSILFHQRRKQMGNLIQNFLHRKLTRGEKERLEAAGFSMQIRPERVSPDDLWTLFSLVKAVTAQEL